MDFLLELILTIFVEAPLDAAMESKRIKTWVKTLIVFLLGNLLTALFVLAAMKGSEEPGVDLLSMGIAAVWFLAVIGMCIYGQKKKWNDQSDILAPKPAEIPGNEPKAGLTIRTATMADLEAIARVEAACFPAAEAATKEEFRERLSLYADHFWLMFDGEELISFVDGFVTDIPDLTDNMYADASMHDPNGSWQMVFGVNTVPQHRCHGYAGQLIERAIADARSQGRKGLVLTCKPEKVPYYIKFGFRNEGISKDSTHGGVVWHQMRLTF